jgi:vesicle coat complex subunit
LTSIFDCNFKLAQAVVDAGSIPHLVNLISSSDAKLKRQACCALAQIARHSLDLAETVIDGDIFPRVLLCFKDMDFGVRRQTALLLCEIAKHSPDVSTEHIFVFWELSIARCHMK